MDGQLALNQTIRVGSTPTRRTNFGSVVQVILDLLILFQSECKSVADGLAWNQEDGGSSPLTLTILGIVYVLSTLSG